MTKHTLIPRPAYEPKSPKSPEPLQGKYRENNLQLELSSVVHLYLNIGMSSFGIICSKNVTLSKA